MNQLITNILSAMAVSLIITAMAKVRSQRLKAILYTLPFPITIALIGSNGIATSLSLSGLSLTVGFLWGCYYLHTKLKLNVIQVDVLLALLYIAVAYLLTSKLRLSFWTMLSIYAISWVSLMAIFRKKTFKYIEKGNSKTNVLFKMTIIFIIALILFSARQYLAAFVVTFPYNGVFAVYENRYSLMSQAALFTRNSIALAMFFVANYLAGNNFHVIIRYLLSWVAFIITLVIVNRFISIRVKAQQLHS